MQIQANEFEEAPFLIEDHDEKWASDEELDHPGAAQDNDMSSCSENGSPNAQMDQPIRRFLRDDTDDVELARIIKDFPQETCKLPKLKQSLQVEHEEIQKQQQQQQPPQRQGETSYTTVSQRFTDDVCRLESPSTSAAIMSAEWTQHVSPQLTPKQMEQSSFTSMAQRFTDDVCRLESPSTSATMVPAEWHQHVSPQLTPKQMETASFTSMAQRFTDDVCRLDSPSTSATMVPAEWHQHVSPQLTPKQMETSSFTSMTQRFTDDVCRLDSPSTSATIMPAEWQQQVSPQLTPKQMETSSYTSMTQRFTDDTCIRESSSTSAAIVPAEWHQQISSQVPPRQVEKSSFTSVSQRYTDDTCRREAPSTAAALMPADWHQQVSPQVPPRQVEKSSFTAVSQRFTDDTCRREAPSTAAALMPADWHQQVSPQVPPRQVEKSSFTAVSQRFTDDTCRREAPSTAAALMPADWHQQVSPQVPPRQVEKSSFTTVSQRYTDQVCRREAPPSSGTIVPTDWQKQVSPQPAPPLSPSRPKSPWCMLDPYASSEKDCREYVGFATLPNQVHRKSVKRGFEFTILVAGESGLGKSTLVNSLFLTDLYKDRVLLNAEERIAQTVEIVKHTVDIEEKGVKLRLTVVDTPGFGDALNNSESWKAVADYVEQQCEQYFRDESGLDRRNIQDNRVHCCLYFISPFGHGLRPLDIEFMRALHNRVNIVPVLGKADTLTPTEVERKKQKIREEICEHCIRIYQFPDCDSDEDEEFKAQDEELKKSIPFAVIGSNTVVEANGKRVRGRLYPWGIVEVENPCHCDFLKLRTMLVKTHMQDLKDVTKECHYENYRSQCIQNMTRMVVKERNRNKLTRESGTDFPMPVTATAADRDTEQMIREKNQELQRMQEMLQKISCQMKMDLQ